ncbi:MAG: hypothetical protein ACXVBX_15435 [Flavisolibacter sp.]
MSLSSDIIKKLNRKFDPSATTHFRYGSNDVVIRPTKKVMPSVLSSERQIRRAS